MRIRQVHNGGFHAHPAGAAVHNGIDFSVMVVEHMRCGGGGGLAGKVGGGGGNGHPGQPDDGPGHVIVRAAHGHGGEPSGGAFGHDVLGRQHHGQRPRPEFFRQCVGDFRNGMAEFLDFPRLRHMEDQGVVLGPALGGENACHSLLVETVCTKSVDGFRGDGHQPTPADDGCCRGRGAGVGGG